MPPLNLEMNNSEAQVENLTVTDVQEAAVSECENNAEECEDISVAYKPVNNVEEEINHDMTITHRKKKHTLNELDEKEDNENTQKENSSCGDSSSCAKCLNEKKQNFQVYHKNSKDRINNNASVRAALYELSPQWFKSFLIDPEYVMTGAKKADE